VNASHPPVLPKRFYTSSLVHPDKNKAKFKLISELCF